MKFISILLCLIILSACAEKDIKEELNLPKKSCAHFTQHSRNLPIANSAIEIFEGQEFDAVVEVIKDSVRYIKFFDDTSNSSIPKILVFIDQKEEAPYREIIYQSLPSNGYWIYYACYDTLEKECFLPEFYDIDHDRTPDNLKMITYSPFDEIRIVQNESNEISIEDRYFESVNSDSAKLYLNEEMERDYSDRINRIMHFDTYKTFNWINHSILAKLREFNTKLKINTTPINQDIVIYNNLVSHGSPPPVLSEIKYATNFQENINLTSLVNQSKNDLYNSFKSIYSFTQQAQNQFSQEELQQLPFLISSPLKFKYSNHSIWQLVPPPPPPPMPPISNKKGCGTESTTVITNETEVIWPDEIEIIEEDIIETSIKIEITE